MTDQQNPNDKNKNLAFMKNNLKVLDPITRVKYVEVPKYVYQEKIIHKTEVVQKNVCVPYDGPVYKIKYVNVPVYKEKIRYVPKEVEIEKIYEIPKLNIKDRVEEDLLILHKNNITHKKLNYVVERIIPTLHSQVVETTKKIPCINFTSKPNNESSNFVLSNSAVSQENLEKIAVSEVNDENDSNQKKEEMISGMSEQASFQKENEQEEGIMAHLNKLEEIFESYKHIMPSKDSYVSSKNEKQYDMSSNSLSSSSSSLYRLLDKLNSFNKE